MGTGHHSAWSRREFNALLGSSLLWARSSSTRAGADALPSPASTFAEGQAAPGGRNVPILDIADWSYHWYGVQRVTLARGTVCNGMQMFVERWIPVQVRRPYPAILIHGGYGQGSDWLSTPDGRRGWTSLLLEHGYQVYVLDRPGQGRNPYHPWVHGAFDPQAPTFERAVELASGAGSRPVGSRHTQWPGRLEIDDPAIAQVAAALGQPMAVNPITEALWRSRAALLLDDVGPAVLVTHGDGALLAWAAAAERPRLVKGIVVVEQPSHSIQGQGPDRLARLAAVPIAIVTGEASPASATDPAIAQALRDAGCRVEHIRLADRGVRGNGPLLVMERNNREALALIVDWLAAAVERPSPAGSPAAAGRGIDPARNRESTAVRLADQGGFWIGIQRKRMAYGTIPVGQMFVQYMIPAERRSAYPVVMVHGGGGQGTHMMGLGGRPGFVHYFVQSGYSVYWLDRPSYGRSPYHPDALGPSHLPNVPPFEPLLESPAVFKTGQWPGPGGMDDPFINQFMACESGNVTDEAWHTDLVWPGGVELLDRIGPAILFTHAFGGFFGWGVADRRPQLVKAIVCMEINGNPFERQLRWGLTARPVEYDPPVEDPGEFVLVERTPPPDSPRPIASPYKLQADPPRRWKNLQHIPVAWVTSEFGAGGSPVANVEFLKQVGCQVEMLRLRDFGILGNGNLMLLEKNNHEVFTVIRGWLERTVPVVR